MGRRKGGPLLNTNAAMRNCPSETRKMVVFSYDWLHTALLACVRSKQLVPSGCGSNRLYHGCRVSTSSAASCGARQVGAGRRTDGQRPDASDCSPLPGIRINRLEGVTGRAGNSPGVLHADKPHQQPSLSCAPALPTWKSAQVVNCSMTGSQMPRLMRRAGGRVLDSRLAGWVKPITLASTVVYSRSCSRYCESESKEAEWGVRSGMQEWGGRES